MKNKKFPIWNHDFNVEDYADYLDEEMPEVTDPDEKYRIAAEINDEYLDDERNLLDVRVGTDIIIIGHLHLWDGVRTGYKMLPDAKISDCLHSDYDPNWYVTEYGDIECRDSHHDGTNIYTYRGVRPGRDIEKFQEKIYGGKVSQRDIAYYTFRLGDFVADVYGFKLKGRRPALSNNYSKKEGNR